MPKTITTQAHSNIALIKYWGKRNEHLFLPTKSSLSVTLKGLTTTTTINFSDDKQDHIILNNTPAQGSALIKAQQFLNRFRSHYKTTSTFTITSTNNFPTAAGLASSASGFAALTLGLLEFCGENYSLEEASRLARQGSGSASRSLHGGFVLWNKGEQKDGKDSFAEQLFPANHWKEFRILVVILQDKEKETSSRDGMVASIETSPSYKKWIQESEKRIPLMQQAIKDKDMSIVGELAEQDCLGMHKTMHDSTPPLNYWTEDTVTLMETVHNLRRTGTPCYFTIDAGPNVKILTTEHYEPLITKELKRLPIIKKTLSCTAGDGASVVTP